MRLALGMWVAAAGYLVLVWGVETATGNHQSFAYLAGLAGADASTPAAPAGVGGPNGAAVGPNAVLGGNTTTSTAVGPRPPTGNIP